MSYEIKPNWDDRLNGIWVGLFASVGFFKLMDPFLNAATNYLSQAFEQSANIAAEPAKLLALSIPHLGVATIAAIGASKLMDSIVKASALDGGRVVASAPSETEPQAPYPASVF